MFWNYRRLSIIDTLWSFLLLGSLLNSSVQFLTDTKKRLSSLLSWDLNMIIYFLPVSKGMKKFQL